MDSVTIDIGKEIKKVLNEKSIKTAHFAKKLDTTRQNASDILTRQRIDTELLAKISRILEFDFFSLYKISETQTLFDENLINENDYEISINIKVRNLEKTKALLEALSGANIIIE